MSCRFGRSLGVLFRVLFRTVLRKRGYQAAWENGDYRRKIQSNSDRQVQRTTDGEGAGVGVEKGATKEKDAHTRSRRRFPEPKALRSLDLGLSSRWNVSDVDSQSWDDYFRRLPSPRHIARRDRLRLVDESSRHRKTGQCCLFGSRRCVWGKCRLGRTSRRRRPRRKRCVLIADGFLLDVEVRAKVGTKVSRQVGLKPLDDRNGRRRRGWKI